MDDLDKLLEDLGRPKTTTPKKPRAPSSRVDLDELEDLMHDLAAKPVTAKAVSSTPAPAPVRESVQARPVSSSFATSDTDDLDALMASLNSSSRNSVRASMPPAAPPVSQPQPVPIYTPQAAPVPTPISPPAYAQHASSAATMDDLDELLSNLEPANSRASVAVAKPAPAPVYKPASVYNPPPADNRASVNMAASVPASRPAVAKPPANTYKPAGQNVRPVAGDDLDNLLTNLTSQMSDLDASHPASRGTCAQCHKSILGEVIQALGRTFHPEHFVCGNCQEPLGTANFYEQDGLPHCERCYQELFCARCAHCDEPILDRCVTALNKKWHINHFICTQCLNPFEGGTFFERDGRPFCENCFYGAFASRCAGCNQAIRGECINALGQQWHPEHFVCQYCQKSFAGGTFYEYGGKPYCEVHYHQQTGSLCAGCGKAVTGRCVNALDKKWHPEHFICAFCMNPLAGGSFTENNGKAYCKDCHAKLFG